MNQIGPPSAAQGKHVEDWLQTSIGKSRSGRFAAEWWTSMLKTSNTQMVNSGNRQTPAAKHLLLLAFGAQAMLSAISRVCRHGQRLHENMIFHIFLDFVKSRKATDCEPAHKNDATTKEAKSRDIKNI